MEGKDQPQRLYREIFVENIQKQAANITTSAFLSPNKCSNSLYYTADAQ